MFEKLVLDIDDAPPLATSACGEEPRDSSRHMRRNWRVGSTRGSGMSRSVYQHISVPGVRPALVPASGWRVCTILRSTPPTSFGAMEVWSGE